MPYFMRFGEILSHKEWVCWDLIPQPFIFKPKHLPTSLYVELMKNKAEQSNLCRKNQQAKQTLEAYSRSYTQHFSVLSVVLGF